MIELAIFDKRFEMREIDASYYTFEITITVYVDTPGGE